MHYVNNPNTKAMKYTDLVNTIIELGIAPQRAYMYLACLGIKGQLARIKSSDSSGYNPPVKLAARGDDTIESATLCSHCKGIVIT